MHRFLLFLGVAFCLATIATAQSQESIVPAGTVLQCTLDEPAFSSATEKTGDPVLCHVGPLSMFEHPVFPRGADLTGRFVDYRDPGHFVGKGWLKLEFDTLKLPGGAFPISARVVSASHYTVDKSGKIHGHGHPRRDAVEWAVPVLWPEKVVTLPMRGPRPVLKNETQVVLRLQDDLSIPTA